MSCRKAGEGEKDTIREAQPCHWPIRANGRQACAHRQTDIGRSTRRASSQISWGYAQEHDAGHNLRSPRRFVEEVVPNQSHRPTPRINECSTTARRARGQRQHSMSQRQHSMKRARKNRAEGIHGSILHSQCTALSYPRQRQHAQRCNLRTSTSTINTHHQHTCTTSSTAPSPRTRRDVTARTDGRTQRTHIHAHTQQAQQRGPPRTRLGS